MGRDGEGGGSELLTRVQVVDGASLRFQSYSEARQDNWDIEWEATPAPVGRSEPRSAAGPVPTPRAVSAPPATLPPVKPKPPASATPAKATPKPTPRKAAVPRVLPDPVYVPAPDATPQVASRHDFDELEELDEVAVEEVEPDDTFPPLSDPPSAVHELYPPGDVAPGEGDRAPTWDPPHERQGIPSSAAFPAPAPPRQDPFDPSGYAVPDFLDGPRAPEPELEAPATQRGRRAGIQEIDALPVVFSGLSPRVVESAVGHFDVFEVKAGTQLIEAGERHPALVMVLVGEISADRHGTRRIAREGECLGFTTLFGDGVWASTLKARVASRLLVLDLDGFRSLRAQGSVVSVAIEEYALDLMVTALSRTRQRVAQLSTGLPMKSFVPKQRFFDVLADAFGMGGIMATRTNVQRALEASPLFRNAEPSHLAAIGERMGALKAQAGSFFTKQGEASTSMYLVVSGQVDILTTGRDDRAVRHETLGPGQLFGAAAMMRDRPSEETVVARTRCTVLELDKLTWAELAPSHTGTGSVLRLAVLRALTGALVQESARLASLEAGHAPQVEASTSGSFMTINPIDRR